MQNVKKQHGDCIKSTLGFRFYGDS